MAGRIVGTWGGYVFRAPGGVFRCMGMGLRCAGGVPAVLEADGLVYVLDRQGRRKGRGHKPLTRRDFHEACLGEVSGSAALSPTFRLRTREAVHLLKGLVAVDLAQVGERFAGLRGGGFPLIRAIQTGRVRYERADPDEHWQSYREIMAPVSRGGIGRADCEDLSAGVTAELLYNGIEARPYVYKAAPRLYHVVVQTKRWGFLDPSRAAGMEGDG